MSAEPRFRVGLRYGGRCLKSHARLHRQPPDARRLGLRVKWDGFRAIVSTEGLFRIRSRRGWDMTPFLPEFAELRPHDIYDAERIAFGKNGRPDFPLVCERLLHRQSRIPLAR